VRLLAALCSAVAVYVAADWVGGRLPRLPLPRPHSADPGRQQRWLVQAGVPLTPRQFWAGCATLGALTFWGAVVATSTPAVALVPALAATLLPRLYFARTRARRLRQVRTCSMTGTSASRSR
jgi:hypothetical protein